MGKYGDQAKAVFDFVGTLGKEIPDVGAGFSKIHQGSLKEGALTTKEKELIALGIGIAIRCEGCISCHVKAALSAGASEKEIIETIGVAVLMGGGPSIVYGDKAHKAMKEMM